jgi:hypothetical protein
MENVKIIYPLTIHNHLISFDARYTLQFKDRRYNNKTKSVG